MNDLHLPQGPTRDLAAFNLPFTMVIFGITGDLAQNKLVPALFSLYHQKLLPDRFSIIGFSRRQMTHDELRNFFC